MNRIAEKLGLEPDACENDMLEQIEDLQRRAELEGRLTAAGACENALLIARAADAVSTAVYEAEQIWVRTLREAAENGRMTAVEMKIALRIARRSLGAEGLRRLADALGTGEDGLGPCLASPLEDALSRMKGAP